MAADSTQFRTFRAPVQDATDQHADAIEIIMQKSEIPKVVMTKAMEAPEKIMKYVLEAVTKQTCAYFTKKNQKRPVKWNTLGLHSEKYVLGSKNPTSFRKFNNHINNKIPASMGHSNDQRPDGCFEFACANERAHLFVEIDQDNKNKQRAIEANKIWQDISASIAGSQATRQPVSASTCVLRLNIHHIFASAMTYAKATASQPPGLGSVQGVSRSLQNEYNVRNIDEVKQIFLSMHLGMARQIITVISAWLMHTFHLQSKQKHDLYKWMATHDKKRNPQTDWCFWIGEYDLVQHMNRDLIRSQTPSPAELEKASEKWPKIMHQPGAGFRGNLRNADTWRRLTVTNLHHRSNEGNEDNTDWGDREHEYADTFNLQQNEVVRRMTTSNGGWQYGDKSVHAAVDNTCRYQGMWVELLEQLRDDMSEELIGDQVMEQNIAEWIRHTCDQEPVLNIEVDCFAMQGDGVADMHDYHTRIQFNNAHSELCQFELKVGLYGFGLPRMPQAIWQDKVNEFLEKARDDNDQAANKSRRLPVSYGDYLLQRPDECPKSMQQIWQELEAANKFAVQFEGMLVPGRKSIYNFHIRNTSGIASQSIPPNLPLSAPRFDAARAAGMSNDHAELVERYQNWSTMLQREFDRLQNRFWGEAMRNNHKMVYSTHLADLMEVILHHEDAMEREITAHLLFRNTRKDEDLQQAQPNKLPLSHLFPGANARADDRDHETAFWNVSVAAPNNVCPQVVPLLWEPLSAMLINAILFHIRSIRQGTPGNRKGGAKRGSNVGSSVRTTKPVYEAISHLATNNILNPDFFTGHAKDSVPEESINLNLNSMVLRRVLNQNIIELDASLQRYLLNFNSEYCIAFCKLIRCTDAHMLHWLGQMYQNHQQEDEINRYIKMFPLAAQAMIVRLLATAADDYPMVWQNNLQFENMSQEESDDENTSQLGGDSSGHGSDGPDEDGDDLSFSRGRSHPSIERKTGKSGSSSKAKGAGRGSSSGKETGRGARSSSSRKRGAGRPHSAPAVGRRNSADQRGQRGGRSHQHVPHNARAPSDSGWGASNDNADQIQIDYQRERQRLVDNDILVPIIANGSCLFASLVWILCQHQIDLGGQWLAFRWNNSNTIAVSNFLGSNATAWETLRDRQQEGRLSIDEHRKTTRNLQRQYADFLHYLITHLRNQRSHNNDVEPGRGIPRVPADLAMLFYQNYGDGSDHNDAIIQGMTAERNALNVYTHEGDQMVIVWFTKWYVPNVLYPRLQWNDNVIQRSIQITTYEYNPRQSNGTHWQQSVVYAADNIQFENIDRFHLKHNGHVQEVLDANQRPTGEYAYSFQVGHWDVLRVSPIAQ